MEENKLFYIFLQTSLSDTVKQSFVTTANIGEMQQAFVCTLFVFVAFCELVNTGKEIGILDKCHPCNK